MIGYKIDTYNLKLILKFNNFSSIVIIGIASGCSMEILDQVIEATYNAVVLIVGTEEIETQRNIERLKRELRVCRL